MSSNQLTDLFTFLTLVAIHIKKMSGKYVRNAPVGRRTGSPLPVLIHPLARTLQ